jgi:Fibronectin type III domain
VLRITAKFSIGVLIVAAGILVIPGLSGAKGADTLIKSISCSSTTSCMAVGTMYDGTSQRALAEQWNGSSWTTVPTYNTAPTDDNNLFGVSCPSATWCIAVGMSPAGALIEQWNGSSWTNVPSPAIPSSSYTDLEGVSCPSTTLCIAVGIVDTSSEATLVEQWDGSNWSVVPSANVPGSPTDQLYSVSCPTTTSCIAVGAYLDNGNWQTLAEAWNGSNWTIVPSGNTAPSDYNFLLGVSCTSASSCFAVGYGGSMESTVVQQWNGQAFTIVASPSLPAWQSSSLVGITCVSATFCVAGGGSDDGTNLQDLVEQWNGSSWTIVPSPSSSSNGFQDQSLEAMACTSVTVCFGGGFTFDGTTYQQTIVPLTFAPVAPTDLHAVPGNGQATISWTTADGADTSYTATASPGGASCTTTANSCTISGLANGTSYSITVTATNSVATSPTSLPVTVTPAANGALANLAATGAGLVNLMLFGLGVTAIGAAALGERRRRWRAVATLRGEAGGPERT